MSRSRTNLTVICARPSAMRAMISSIPETPLMACSIGSTTDVDISSGLAPGSDSDDVDRRRIGFGEEIDAEAAERERSEHHQRHHEHRRRYRPSYAEFR